MMCEIVLEGRRYAAIMRDISPAGLFVQTRARPEVNSTVELVFSAAGDQPEVTVEAGVARERQIAPHLQATTPGGLGLELLNPPPGFRELLARELAEEANAEATQPQAAAAGMQRTFRVRVTELGKRNSRIVTIRSESLQGARAQALARAGRGWRVTEVQEV
ncbi:unnamed protein product [marine sediment metagenome]|uniref:PilZ domain-containing protein n=1 Tax=marine sediment metagenome TaxID=412755 RepID=X0RTC6_9ZZZZ